VQAATTDERIASGDSILQYEVNELAGRGGMGDVYRAFDTRLERPVALKLLSSRLSDDESFGERMLRESRIAASLDHPNVVPIYEAGEAGGRLFIAMRYVDGSDLRALLRRQGALQPERAVAIAAQVADALDAAHARGLVHRDVKPSNVLLDQQGGREHVYLADFGLTQSASEPSPTDGQLMGTVDYVAPEQIRGEEIDGRADVYALGCLVFEALTGTVPYSGPSEVAVLYSHLEEEPPAASERRPTLSSAVDEVLLRAMAKEPDERQATCRELVDEARTALGLEARLPGRRRLAVGLVIAAFVVAVGIVAAALLLRTDATPDAAPTGGVVRLDAQTGHVGAPIRLGPAPTSIAARDGTVWVGSIRDGDLWKITASTGAVERLTSIGSPRDIAIRGGTTYVASDGQALFTGTVASYALHSGYREASAPVLACSLTADATAVWAAGCPNVVEIDPVDDKLRIGPTLHIPFREPVSVETYRWCLCAMAAGLHSIWVIGDWSDTRLWRIDPVARRVASTFELPFKPRTFAVGQGAVWVVDPARDQVARIDPGTGRVTATIAVGRGALGIAVGAGSVWVANHLDGTVSRIDPARAEVADTIQVGTKPVELAVDGSDVWVLLEGP
jgi:YVTN family beta-propeller protein